MQQANNPAEGKSLGHRTSDLTMSIGETSSVSNNKAMGKRPGKRPGRKPSKIDERAKLERSRQSARECRARKKLRYQYLEELVVNREKAVFALRDELEMYKQWCIQLENGGPVPETLLKMLANEEMSTRRRIMEQFTRSQNQQQKLQQQFQLTSSSSSSSTSPDSSPSSQLEHHRNRHIHIVPPQTIPNQSSHLSQPFSQVTNNSSPQHQLQLHQLLLRKQTECSASVLQRQLAFDQTKSQDIQSQTTTNQKSTSSAHVRTQDHFIHQKHIGQPNSMSPKQQQHKVNNILSSQQSVNNILPSHQSVNNILQPQQTVNSILQTQQVYSSQQPENFQEIPQEALLSGTRNEPYIKHGSSFDIFQTYSNTGSEDSSYSSSGVSSHSSGEAIRKRSLSNPATMNSSSRTNLLVTSAQDMPSSLKDFITFHSVQVPTLEQSDMGFGLFSGSLVKNANIKIPTTITIEESSSSDEDISEQKLFKSSVMAQKRTLSAPHIFGNPKRSMMTSGTMNSKSLTSDYRTEFGLGNFYSSDVTKTTNAPLSYAEVSSDVSPKSSLRFSGPSSLTPSSSATASPAPLSSLSSILELSDSSPALSSAVYGTSLETANSSHFGQLGSTTNSILTEELATSSNHLMPEPIPDWYSFLDDLRDISTLSSRHIASTTPVTLAARHEDTQPDQAFMNVPNIIDEILDSDDQLL